MLDLGWWLRGVRIIAPACYYPAVGGYVPFNCTRGGGHVWLLSFSASHRIYRHPSPLCFAPPDTASAVSLDSGALHCPCIMRASFRANEWVRLDRGPVVRVDHQKPSLAQNPILLSHRCTHRPLLQIKQLARTGLRHPYQIWPSRKHTGSQSISPTPSSLPCSELADGGAAYLILAHYQPGSPPTPISPPGGTMPFWPTCLEPGRASTGLRLVLTFVGYDMHAGTLQSRPTRRESTKTITVSRTTSHHFSDSRPDITHPLISLETDQCCDPARTFNHLRAACPALYIAPASRRTAGTELNTS